MLHSRDFKGKFVSAEEKNCVCSSHQNSAAACKLHYEEQARTKSHADIIKNFTNLRFITKNHQLFLMSAEIQFFPSLQHFLLTMDRLSRENLRKLNDEISY